MLQWKKSFIEKVLYWTDTDACEVHFCKLYFLPPESKVHQSALCMSLCAKHTFRVTVTQSGANAAAN